MSYCRFSSDDSGCDLYCYGSAEGYVTHVAANRPVGDVPEVPADWHAVDVGELVDAMNAQVAFLLACPREPIGLPHDGATFVDVSASSFLDRLLCLCALGYRFPDHVLDDARDDAAEEASDTHARV